VTTDFTTPLRPRGPGRSRPGEPAARPAGPDWLPARPAAPRARVLLIAVNLAAVTFFLLSFSRHGVGLRPYRIDLDVYRIGGQVWLHGGNLYGVLPATASGVRLPFSYPPFAAILLSPLSLVPMAVAGAVLTLGTVALAAVVLRVFLGSLWTSVITATSRPGSPVYAANQSIQGVLARAGLDPHSLTGTAAWLALSAAVLVLACLGMRRALAGAADAWALSLNAFAALLVSPISWSHHWVWGEAAMLALAVLSRRACRRPCRRAALTAAAAGLAVFAAAPQWWFPSGENRELRWAAWQQVIGSSYVIVAVAVLLLSARFSWPASSGCYQATRDISWVHRLCPLGGTGFRRALWLRDMRCGSVTRSGKPRRPRYASTSPAGGSTRTSSTSGSPRCSPPRRAAT
jgi:hypothetical protein